MTPAKAKALAAVHAARKGKRVNPPAPSGLAILRRTLRPRRGVFGDRDKLTVRQVAADIGVSDRTLRRWLSGTDRPSAKHHPAIVRVSRIA